MVSVVMIEERPAGAMEERFRRHCTRTTISRAPIRLTTGGICNRAVRGKSCAGAETHALRSLERRTRLWPPIPLGHLCGRDVYDNRDQWRTRLCAESCASA